VFPFLLTGDPLSFFLKYKTSFFSMLCPAVRKELVCHYEKPKQVARDERSFHSAQISRLVALPLPVKKSISRKLRVFE
jgi:hypothetical protein